MKKLGGMWLKATTKDNVCSSYEIFMYRQRAEILCLSYIYALELIPGVTWAGVCEKAC
jgi:hypothetical protein